MSSRHFEIVALEWSQRAQNDAGHWAVYDLQLLVVSVDDVLDVPRGDLALGRLPREADGGVLPVPRVALILQLLYRHAIGALTTAHCVRSERASIMSLVKIR